MIAVYVWSARHMARNVPPLSVRLLALELSDVDNWYQLGTVLGVPPKRLDEIRKSSPVGGTGEWRISMLQVWMDSKSDASWADVIEAVKSLRHIRLAAILKSKYVPKTTEPSHDAVPTKVAEVHASVAVVKCVLHVQKCFSQMLTTMRQLSARIDIKNVRFFLESILEADEFNTCKGFEDVLRLLRKSYIDTFNTSYLEQLAEYLEIDEINQLISAYKRERDAFFKDPIVTEFQDAVFNKVEPLFGEDEVIVPEVRLPHSLVNKRTQRDMETLATQFCGSYREPVVQMDNVPESKNVTSKCTWPVCIAVLLGITTILLVILTIGSLFEISSLNAQVVELRAQLTQCQNEKRQMKECEEEVKNLTEVKGMFLAMKEESNNSLAVAKRADDLLDRLSKHNERTRDELLECENSHRKLKAEFQELLLISKQFIIEYDKVCRNELTKCETKHGKLLLNLIETNRERYQYFFNYLSCIAQLTNYKQFNDELRKNVSMLESENDKLTKSYTHCSERLTTCEESRQFYSLLYSRKCFKVMQGHVELICQPIFVM